MSSKGCHAGVPCPGDIPKAVPVPAGAEIQNAFLVKNGQNDHTLWSLNCDCAAMGRFGRVDYIVCFGVIVQHHSVGIIQRLRHQSTEEMQKPTLKLCTPCSCIQ